MDAKQLYTYNIYAMEFRSYKEQKLLLTSTYLIEQWENVYTNKKRVYYYDIDEFYTKIYYYSRNAMKVFHVFPPPNGIQPL